MFHASYRLEYMGIDWGWIHLGLSTNKFRQDSRALYRRSFLMAALAISVNPGLGAATSLAAAPVSSI